jgi:hypothetical protein
MAMKKSQATASLSRNKTCSSAKAAINSEVEISNMRSRRDINRLVVGISSMLLALGNLALFCFGPEKDNSLTVGVTASIATSLVLAVSALLILRD